MREVLTEIVGMASGRADFVDARHVRSRGERISTRQGAIDELDSWTEEGIGIRVRVGGAWGFAATGTPDRAAAETALERALRIAAAQPTVRATPLVAETPAGGTWRSDCRRDPFEVPHAEKIAVLEAAEQAMRGDSRIALTRAHYMAFRDDTTYVSSEGTAVEQRAVACGGGVEATAIGGGETQVRSYPGSFRGDVAQAGYEYFESLDLVGNAPRVADEAIALLSAPACPSGRMTVVLGSQQLSLQLHESVGHATELDRVLGREASYAGTSYLSATDIGRFRVGSEHMQVSADALVPGGLGTFGWDDEGVAARRTELVTDGVLAGFLSSRETAAEIGLERSGGCMRAEGFARQPIIRMTNVNLAPGDAGTLADLLADTGEGLYLEMNRSWSIDQRRLHFQFATEAAWEIRGGELGRLYRNPSYAGITPEFWDGLDAVCSESEWRLWGLLNCGKGEPGQTMRVSHGTAPARFRNVEVGVA